MATSGEYVPPSDFWVERADMFPASMKICGHSKVENAPINTGTLHFDTDSDKPWLAMVDHLEAKGWKRTSQSVEHKNTKSASFVREGEYFDFRFFLTDGRFRITGKLFHPPCKDKRDLQVCYDQAIIACLDNHIETVVETCTSGCFDDGKGWVYCY